MARYIDANCFKYYVVRHKETGQYFRGKGENKWGMYYNQASIYRFKKHAENAVEDVARRGEPAEVVEIRITAATSDIEKEIDQDTLSIALDKATSEIAALKNSHKDTMKKMRANFSTECVSHYNHGRADAAREIFEEIEKLAKIYTFPVVKNGFVEIAKEPFWCIEPSDLAELKKKYTEEEG